MGSQTKHPNGQTDIYRSVSFILKNKINRSIQPELESVRHVSASYGVGER